MMRVILIEGDEKVRGQFTQALSRAGFQVESYAQWPERLTVGDEGALWLTADQGTYTERALQVLRRHPASRAQAILAYGRGDSQARVSLMTAGADAYLPFPFSGKQLLSEAQRLSSERCPVRAFQCLPPRLAELVDRLTEKLDHGDHYALLDLSPESDDATIRARFRERSFLLHPDRHHQLRQREPVVYARLQMLYKGCLEAYQALSNPVTRRVHMLDQHFSLGDPRRGEVAKQVQSISSSTEGKLALLDAFAARDQGAWFKGMSAIDRARAAEPANHSLDLLKRSFEKLMRLSEGPTGQQRGGHE